MNQALVQAVNWQELIRIGIELFGELTKPVKDWTRIIELGLEIFALLTQAEEASAQKIDWAQLIKILLPIILELIGGFTEDK